MKKWYKSEASAMRDAERENCDIVCGSNGWADIYYLVPQDAAPGIVRVIARAERECGPCRCRVIYKTTDGKLDVIDNTTLYRLFVVRRGLVREELVGKYLRGYYTRREENSKAIRARKEAARVSHELCDAPGAVGHEIRQQIRRQILRLPNSKKIIFGDA